MPGTRPQLVVRFAPRRDGVRIDHRRKVSNIDFKKAAFPAGVAALLGVAALMTGIGRASPSSVGASPSSFELVMNGFHTAAEPRETFSLGFRHEGPFAASAPFCSSGYAVDLELLPGTALRQFTCSDGSGIITARKFLVRADALFAHEEDVWAIVEGTGRYSTLRGKGTSVSDVVSGNPADHITTKFREIFQGVVDFDVTPPEVSISRASAKRLRRPKRAFSIRVAFSARDGDEANPVSYVMTVSGPGVFVLRSGRITSRTVSTAFRVRPRKRVRRLQLVVVASDPVGNETRVARQLRLPS
jgi:hypothetical protein